MSKLYDSLGIERVDTRSSNTYKYGDFLFDVVTIIDQDRYEYWLYSPDCGIKDFGFGVPISSTTYPELLTMILNSIDEDIDFYNEKYNF